jgi:3-methyladenine DNA glycosylase Mpg
MNSFLSGSEKVEASDEQFSDLADKILNHTSLVIRDKTCRICEIEFYLFQDDRFPDRYTHCDPLQLERGRLYFHRLNGRGYKSGTFKCMDITVGDEGQKQYLGILIRSLYSITDDEFISGPCLCVNYLLKQFECREVKELESKLSFPLDLTAHQSEVRLADEDHESERLYVAPRVGLSDRYPEFRQRLYRYAVMTKRIKREKTRFKPLE